MSTITHKFSVPTVSGRTGAVGSLVCTPSARRELDDETVLPASFTEPVADDGTISLVLDDTDDTWGWCIREDLPRGRTRWVLVAGDADYADLEEFDPASGDIKPPLPPVWKGYVDAAIATALALYNATVEIALAAKANVVDVYTKAASDAAMDEAIGDALDTYTPGAEMASAERLTTWQTTATSSAAAVDIPLLSAPVIGKGRPADVELILPSLTHSVAGTAVTVMLIANGIIGDARTQLVVHESAKTAAGGGAGRIAEFSVPLADGVAYTFTARLFAFGVAGTTTAYASNPFHKIQLNVTAR